MTIRFPGGCELSLNDDEKCVGKRCPPLYLCEKLLNQYNTQCRFFQNFADNNNSANGILQATGQKM